MRFKDFKCREDDRELFPKWLLDLSPEELDELLFQEMKKIEERRNQSGSSENE